MVYFFYKPQTVIAVFENDFFPILDNQYYELEPRILYYLAVVMCEKRGVVCLLYVRHSKIVFKRCNDVEENRNFVIFCSV